MDLGFQPEIIIIYGENNDIPAYALYIRNQYNNGVYGYNGDSNIKINVNDTTFTPYRISGYYIAY